MWTFNFVDTQGSAVVIITADSLEKAREYLRELVKDEWRFRCDNPEGTDE